MTVDRATVASKLRAVDVSPRLTAILAYMVGEQWARPVIVRMHVTAEGFLVAGHAGELGADHLLCAVPELIANCRGVARVAELTDAETRWLLARIPGSA